jgi:hypothetical protein
MDTAVEHVKDFSEIAAWGVLSNQVVVAAR